jgi:hypothetical protein
MFFKKNRAEALRNEFLGQIETSSRAEIDRLTEKSNLFQENAGSLAAVKSEMVKKVTADMQKSMYWTKFAIWTGALTDGLAAKYMGIVSHDGIYRAAEQIAYRTHDVLNPANHLDPVWGEAMAARPDLVEMAHLGAEMLGYGWSAAAAALIGIGIYKATGHYQHRAETLATEALAPAQKLVDDAARDVANRVVSSATPETSKKAELQDAEDYAPAPG